ncbi:unnamed protein product [Sphagnum balticum]
MKTRLTVPETRSEGVVGKWKPEVRSDAPADKLPEVSTGRVEGEDPGEQQPAGVRDEMERNETARRSRSCTRRAKRKECKGSKEARKRVERKRTVVSSQNRRSLLRVETQLMLCRRQCETR